MRIQRERYINGFLELLEQSEMIQSDTNDQGRLEQVYWIKKGLSRLIIFESIRDVSSRVDQ